MTKTTMVRILLCAALASLVLSVAACNHTASRSDAQINSDIQARISSDPAVVNKQITVETAKGVATLSGTVASEAERRVAADDAAAIDGVRTVVNNLTVAAASSAHPSAQAKQAKASAQAAEAAHAAALAKAKREREARRERQAERRRRQEEAAARARRRAELRREARERQARAAAAAAYREPARQVAAAAPPPAYSQPAPPQTSYAQPSQSQAGYAQPAAEPQQSAPAPPPPPPAPAFVTVPAGTPLTIRLLDPLDSATASPGQTFRATLSEPVWLNGNVVIPADAELEGRVTEARAAGRMSGSAMLAIELLRVGYNGRYYTIRTDQWSKQIQGRGKNTAEKVGGGAALGAIVGALAGGGKGAGIGALIGGGAGGTAQAVTHPKQVVLNTEARIGFRLAQPVSVRPARYNQRNVGRRPLD